MFLFADHEHLWGPAPAYEHEGDDNVNRKLTSTEAFGVCMAALSVAVAGGIVIVTMLGLFGCADRRPTCADNPRNMSCFTADELQKELNQ